MMSQSLAETREVARFRVGEDAEYAALIAETLKAVAHPLRIRIVAILTAGPQHVTALAEQLGVGQALVSQQLRILRMRKLVRAVRSGGFTYYSLAEPRLQDLVRCMESCTLG